MLRHLLESNFICDARALDERVLVLIELVAQLVDLLVLVEDLKLLEVDVALLKLKSLTILFLHQPLSIFLDLDVFESGTLRLSKFASYLCFFLSDLSRYQYGVLTALILALL